MHSERIKMLEQFWKDDPDDPFCLYALALEYQKENTDKAEELFDELLTRYPDYLPTYYIAGNFYVDQHKQERALQILLKGLDLAKRKKELSAARELQTAIQNLED